MTLQITAEHQGDIRVFPFQTDDKLENPGSNDILEEAAAHAFNIPFEDHEFVKLIDIAEESDEKH